MTRFRFYRLVAYWVLPFDPGLSGTLVRFCIEAPIRRQGCGQHTHVANALNELTRRGLISTAEKNDLKRAWKWTSGAVHGADCHRNGIRKAIGFVPPLHRALASLGDEKLHVK